MKKSTYYNNLFKGKNIEDWRGFPITTKAEFMENFTNLNTVGISKEEAFNTALKSEQNRDFSPKIKGITVGLSSGTSGNRGVFFSK